MIGSVSIMAILFSIALLVAILPTIETSRASRIFAVAFGPIQHIKVHSFDSAANISAVCSIACSKPHFELPIGVIHFRRVG